MTPIRAPGLSCIPKELVLEPLGERQSVDFTPGDYLQIHILPYDALSFYDLVARNPALSRRNNYSLAGNQQDRVLRFNVRIATQPPGQDCAPGVGSSYLFSRKPGDIVTAIGPFGDFHIKPTQREMIYIGGGAGIAPISSRSRTVPAKSASGMARSKQEIFYHDYFLKLAREHHNFSFQLALSSPLAEDRWTGHIGFIHEVVLQQYLHDHRDPGAAEFYVCGPPMMIKACRKMLADLNVPASQIAYDES